MTPAAKGSAMSTPPADSRPSDTPTPPGVSPAPANEPHGEDLDLEEDVAPNLGGEDQMQDA
jgi:hypothetical protein